ncbi:MAG TPA: hypothetical protein PLI05_09690 [Methanotrichaceae archaeon]|nr:hypothetical protein [Methanotrichaceae archaeon]HQF17326.1 hypothetical protein [Methanotrichaceae archaeon]HQI91928.1 hypothetical protein [Methanotrichaceae archaeon]HQJ29253.1 hypothetical protein [Methanotrichaceae archaeon]
MEILGDRKAILKAMAGQKAGQAAVYAAGIDSPGMGIGNDFTPSKPPVR